MLVIRKTRPIGKRGRSSIRVRSVAPGDTVCFGGNGSGDGIIVTGGVWDWEGVNNEAPQFFDGRRSRSGISSAMAGRSATRRRRWARRRTALRTGTPTASTTSTTTRRLVSPGSAQFGQAGGRTGLTIHTNGANGDEGPNPLQGSWSVWIGTNLFLNPEHCAWSQRSGYGDGWSQGIYKAFPVAGGERWCRLHDGLLPPLRVRGRVRHGVGRGFDRRPVLEPGQRARQCERRLQRRRCQWCAAGCLQGLPAERTFGLHDLAGEQCRDALTSASVSRRMRSSRIRTRLETSASPGRWTTSSCGVAGLRSESRATSRRGTITGRSRRSRGSIST